VAELMLDYGTEPLRLNKEEIRNALLSRLKDVLFTLYPEGKIVGDNFQIGDVNGAKGQSLNVCLKGAKAGQWHDFANGQHKGDIFSLWAYRHGLDPKRDFSKVLEQTAEWLGLSIARPITTPKPELSDNIKHALTRRTWAYLTVRGEPYIEMTRIDKADGKKEFRPKNLITGEYKMPDPRPLYNLPGIAQFDTVVFVEGEKCAEVLIQAGYQATTAMGGSETKIEKTDFTPLKGKTVIFWPDNDEPGETYLNNITPALQDVGVQEIRVLTPPVGKPEKWDAADAIAEGFDINAYLKAATLHTNKYDYEAYSIPELLNDNSPMPDDLIAPRFITPGGLTVIGGAPKAGKSDFLCSMLLHAAAGEPFLDIFKPAKALRVFYLQAEIQYHYLRDRIKNMKLPETFVETLADNMHITPELDLMLDDEGIPAVIELIKRKFPDEPPDIIAIDPIRNVFDGGPDYNGLGENDNNAMIYFLKKRVNAIRNAINPDAAIVLVHHTRKITKAHLKDDPFQALSGASALRSYYTAGMIIYRPDEDETQRRLTFELRNGPPIADMLVDKTPEHQWVELDPNTTPLVKEQYAGKLRAERMRQNDKILEVLYNEARYKKKLYTVEVFGNTFEDQYGLGSSATIKKRVTVLMDKQHIRSMKKPHPITGEITSRSKYGYIVTEDMQLGEDIIDPDTGQILEEAVRILPSHYKDAESKNPWKLDNPEDWSFIERAATKSEKPKPPRKKPARKKKR